MISDSISTERVHIPSSRSSSLPFRRQQLGDKIYTTAIQSPDSVPQRLVAHLRFNTARINHYDVLSPFALAILQRLAPALRECYLLYDL